ncbi:zinc-finger domain-containing protein [Thalassobaculum sp. OXR-137]|uniref:zinc-finger domain-containing protein n=1 Tax=Thalassobaculum sp. OXR-137 TaxID=3100173 RepID=UPI002AC8B783|nr:zinc-finger domain-containing protein [Thalassobaculum sp. OXR-137]WPZ35315.1 zinc-finger domain-containing protein [Thalassobaculum sp. OXR-137]
MAAVGNDAFETIEVTGHRVACDGGDGPLGHPRVFLEIPEDEHKVVCPYCSKTYVMVAEGAGEHAA